MFGKMKNKAEAKRLLAALLAGLLILTGPGTGSGTGLLSLAAEKTAQAPEENGAEAEQASPSEAQTASPSIPRAAAAAPSLKEYTGTKSGFSEKDTVSVNDCFEIDLERIEGWGLTAYEGTSAGDTVNTSFRGYKLTDVLEQLGIPAEDIIYLAGRNEGNTYPITLEHTQEALEYTLLAFESRTDQETSWNHDDAIYLAPLMKEAGRDYIKKAEDIRVAWKGQKSDRIEKPSFERRFITFRYGTKSKKVWSGDYSSLDAWEVVSGKEATEKYGVSDSYRGYRLTDVLEYVRTNTSLGYREYQAVRITDDTGKSTILSYDEYSSENTLLAFQLRGADAADKAQKPSVVNIPCVAVCDSANEERYISTVKEIEILDEETGALPLEDISGFSKTASFSVNDCSWLSAKKLAAAGLTAYEASAADGTAYRGYRLADVLTVCGIDPETVTSLTGRTGNGKEIREVSAETVCSELSIVAFEKRTGSSRTSSGACWLAFCGEENAVYSGIRDLRAVYPNGEAVEIEQPEFSASLSVTVNQEKKTAEELQESLTAYEITAEDGNGYRGYLLADVLSLYGYGTSGTVTVAYGSKKTAKLSEKDAMSENAMLAFQIRKAESSRAGQEPETGSAVYLVVPEAAKKPVCLAKVTGLTVTGSRTFTVLEAKDTKNFSKTASLTLNDSVTVSLKKLQGWGLKAYEAKSARSTGEFYRGYKLADILRAAGIRTSEVTLACGRTADYKAGGTAGIIALKKEVLLSNATLVAFEVKKNGKVTAADGLVLAPCLETSAAAYYSNVKDLRLEYPYGELTVESPEFGKKGVNFNREQITASVLSELTAYEVRAQLDGNTYRGYRLKDVLKLKGYESAESVEVTYDDGGTEKTVTLTKEEINDEKTILAFQFRNVQGDAPQAPVNDAAMYLACCSSEDSAKYLSRLKLLKLPVRNDLILEFSDLKTVGSDVTACIVEGFGDSYTNDALNLEAHAVNSNSISFDLPGEGNYTALIRRGGCHTVSIPFGFYDGKVTTWIRFRVDGSTVKYEMQYDSSAFDSRTKTFFVHFTEMEQSGSGAWDQETLDLNWYTPYERNSEHPVFEIGTPEEFAGLAAVVNGLYSADIKTILDNGTSYTPQEYAKLETRKIRPKNAVKADVDSSAGITWYGVMSDGKTPSDFSGATVKLTSDLDMGANYMPVGGKYAVNYSVASNYWDFSAIINSGFAGVLDGQGHTVNYYFSRLKNEAQGFFIFQGLGLIGLLGSDDEEIAASIVSPGVQNLIVTGGIYSCRSLAGVVGRIGKTAKDTDNRGKGATVKNVVNLATVTGTDKKGTCGIVGGGYYQGLIRNAANFGTVTNDGGSDFQANGIVGYNVMTLESVYNVGKVSNAASDDYARAICSDDKAGVEVRRAFWLSGSAPKAMYELGGEKEVTEIASLKGFRTEDFREQLETDPGDWVILTEKNKDRLITQDPALAERCMNMPLPSSFFNGIVVAYEMYDASSEPTVLVDAGTVITRPSKDPEAAGYDFVDFYRDAKFTKTFGAADSITVTKKTVIYAKWDPHTYTVKFANPEGTVSQKKKTVTMGAAYGKLPTAEMTGGTFLGWYTEAEGGRPVTEKTKVRTAANHTLYAQFETAIYRVTFETDGGTVNSGLIKRYTFGKGAKLPTDVTKDGYTFKGWYDNAELKGSPVTEITATDAGDKVFYAKFTKKSTGGGGGGSSGGGGGTGGGGGSGGSGGVSAAGAVSAGTGATFSPNWYADANGVWRIRNSAGATVTSAWLCDNAITANGQNVWYLLNTDGTMLAAGLVQDNTGNFYSLETTHNGYYGSLRYKNGTYDCNGQQVYLEFSQNHDGTFGKILNADGLEKLKAIYGVTAFGIDNSSCTYTASF